MKAPPDKRVPTLTEVIEVALEPQPVELPSTEAMPLEDLPGAALLELLQPRLEAWVEQHVQDAVATVLPALVEQVTRQVIQDLRNDLPALLARAHASIGAAGKRR